MAWPTRMSENLSRNSEEMSNVDKKSSFRGYSPTYFQLFTARLKPCPFKTVLRRMVSGQVLRENAD
jgi:hypothetical protein